MQKLDRVLKLVVDQQLRATLNAHPTRKGGKALRTLLDTERGPRIVRSEAVRLALRVMRAHGLEPDESDVPIGPYRVDFLFRDERLAVEVDGATPTTRHRSASRMTARLAATLDERRGRPRVGGYAVPTVGRAPRLASTMPSVATAATAMCRMASPLVGRNSTPSGRSSRNAQSPTAASVSAR